MTEVGLVPNAAGSLAGGATDGANWAENVISLQTRDYMLIATLADMQPGCR